MSRRPLPRAIYWRRRLLVVASVIGLVWVGSVLWPGGGPDDTVPASAPAATPSSTPAPSASASPSATEPTASPTPTAEDGQQAVTVTLPAGRKPCDAEQVRITPSVPAEQRSGAGVVVDLLLSTTAKEPCTLQPADAETVAIISSGDTPVWDSSVCRSALLTTAVELSPGWATTVATRWSGKGSGVACSDAEGFVGPGKYRLRIGTFGGEPGATSFSLGAPAPKPKPKPKATPSLSASATADEKADDEKADEPADEKPADD